MSKKTPNLKISGFIAFAIFIFDGFILNQGVVAFIVLIIAGISLLITAYSANDDKLLKRKKLISAGIYSGMMALTLVSIWGNNLIARKNVEIIISAVEKYEARYGRYPEKLNSIVPEFLPEIPPAKYTFSGMANRFWYIQRDNRASIFYVAMPPFGRPTYEFNDKKWIYID